MHFVCVLAVQIIIVVIGWEHSGDFAVCAEKLQSVHKGDSAARLLDCIIARQICP